MCGKIVHHQVHAQLRDAVGALWHQRHRVAVGVLQLDRGSETRARNPELSQTSRRRRRQWCPAVVQFQY
jgi:hypothetical protein